MKVVLDTNVLISATFWEGEAFHLLQLLENKKFTCFLSPAILQEYVRIGNSLERAGKSMHRHASFKEAALKISFLCSWVEPMRKVCVIVEDPDDNKILECAIAAQTPVIVTYDKHLLKIKLFEGIAIISLTAFLALLEKK